jgi:hypothetical protein
MESASWVSGAYLGAELFEVEEAGLELLLLADELLVALFLVVERVGRAREGLLFSAVLVIEVL